MSRSRPDRPIRWRSRPLLAAATLIAAGILLDDRLPPNRIVLWCVLACTAILIGAVVAWYPRRRLVTLRPLALTACVALALTSLGGLRNAVWKTSLDAPLSLLAAEVDAYEHAFPILISGRVEGNVTRTERRLRFALRVDSAGFEDLAPLRGRADATVWSPRDYDSSHRVEMPIAEWPDLRPGHRVIVEGILRPLPSRRNPADFDFGAYLGRQGFHAVIAGSGIDAVRIREYAPTRSEHLLARVRQHVRAALMAHVRDPDARAVLQALLLADRSGIDPQIRQGFARTGLAHLLAVSGLHVFLVGMVIYGLLKPVLHRTGLSWRQVEIIRAVLTLVLVGSYVAIVGGPTSAVRALVMATALIAGRMVERPSNALNSLGGAAIALLLVRPAALMDVGFQLSFTAVAALVLLIPQFERLVPPRFTQHPVPNYVTALVLASLAATLGTMPVLLAHFGLFPLAGVVLNVIAIPSTALALAGGLLAVVFHGRLFPLAAAAGASADLFARVVLATGLRGEQWLGWTAVGIHVTDRFVLISLTCAVLTVAFASRPRLRWRTAACSCACVAVAIWMAILRGDHRPALDFIFLDVGQGDAVLVTFPSGSTLLVDAGPRDPYGDAAARTILPHLERFRIRRLDAVVVTHPHADHLGGVPTLLETVPVGVLYDNGQEYDSDLYRESMALAERLAIPVVSLTAGDRIDIDPAVKIHVLHPGPEPDPTTNDASVVLRISYGELTFILAGDVETAAEATISSRFGASLCAQLVKVAHHGSRTSSTVPFVTGVTDCGFTQYAIVPVARRNRYNLPNDDALERWSASGADVLLTSTEGAVWMRSDGQRVWRYTWR